MRNLPSIARVAICVLVVSAGVARAAPYGEPSYVPEQKLVAGFQSEWLPAGGFYYSGPDGESSTPADTAWGFSGWFGWEVMDRVEVGAAARYVAREEPSGTMEIGHETDLAARVALHSRPYDRIDTWFAIAPGWSLVHLPVGPRYPYGDPDGFVLDLSGGIAYPLGGRLWGVGTAGYQRGFQRTHEPALGPNAPDELIELTTDYFHVGVGMAYRF
jgi:hypothetical protein